jgi:hypothetical protein
MASMRQNEVAEDLKQGEPSMTKIIRIGMDTFKSVFVAAWGGRSLLETEQMV